MATNYTPIVNTDTADATTFNGPLQQLDTALEGIKDGTTTITPAVSSFANSLHDHEDAAGGGQLTDAALSVAVGLAKGGTGADLSATGPGVLRQAAAGGNVGVRLDNPTATAAPTANNDSGDGYEVGSMWYDLTNDIAWICLDAAVGAAVWKPITGSRVPLLEGTLASDATSVDITGWAGLGYKKLIVEWLKLRTNRSGFLIEWLLMTYNDDATATHYASQSMQAQNTTVAAAEAIGTSSGAQLWYAAAGNANSYVWTTMSIEILLPEEIDHHRTATYQAALISDTTGEMIVMMGGSAWSKTPGEAITKITFTPNTGTNLLSGCRWKLYGER